MKRILIFAANSTFILFLVLFVKSNQVFAANCTAVPDCNTNTCSSPADLPDTCGSGSGLMTCNYSQPFPCTPVAAPPEPCPISWNNCPVGYTCTNNSSCVLQACTQFDNCDSPVGICPISGITTETCFTTGPFPCSGPNSITKTVTCTYIPPTPTDTPVPVPTSTSVPTLAPSPTPSLTPTSTPTPDVVFSPQIQETLSTCTAPGTTLHVAVTAQNAGTTSYSFTASLPNNDGNVTGTVNGGFVDLPLPAVGDPDASFYANSAQITINFTVTQAGFTTSAIINNTCQQPTPTNIPTVTPTTTSPTITSTIVPTATPITVAGTQINLKVHLDDIGDTGDNTNPASSDSNQNPNDQTILVKLTATSSTNPATAISTTGMLFFDGKKYTTTDPTTNQVKPIVFSSALPNDTYSFKASSQKYLTKQIPNIATVNGLGPYTLPDVALTAGDATLDNQLTILDWTTIISCENNNSSCDATTRHNADVNDDRVVDGIDQNLFYREFSVEPGQ